MENKKQRSGKSIRLSWHTAFLQAVQLELSDYSDSLEFKYEYLLAGEPLRIDLLIVKKRKGVTVDKNIAGDICRYRGLYPDTNNRVEKITRKRKFVVEIVDKRLGHSECRCYN